MTLFKKNVDPDAPYREEAVLPPALITVAVLALLAAPLLYWTVKINAAGEREANVASLEEMVVLAAANVSAVESALETDKEVLESIAAGNTGAVLAVMVPEDVVAALEPPPAEPEATMADLELRAIYWNPRHPLVGINGATYGVGDVVEGFEVVRVGKNEVVFRAPDGSTQTLDMNEELLEKLAP